MNMRARNDTASGTSFLPEDYIARRTEARANFICLALFVVMMIGLGGAFFVTNRDSSQQLAEQRAISQEYVEQAQQIEEHKRLEEQKAKLFEKAEITTALRERVPRSVLLAELVTRMPEDISLLSLVLSSKRIAEAAPAPDKSKPTSLIAQAKNSSPTKPEEPKVRAPKFEHTLKLEGVASVNNDIADYLTSLQNCPLLENVELSFIKEAKIKDHDLRKFEITASLRPDADARAIAPLARLKQGSGLKKDKEQSEETVTKAPEKHGDW
jgi:Tfp pilus assembly protein PilN